MTEYTFRSYKEGVNKGGKRLRGWRKANGLTQLRCVQLVGGGSTTHWSNLETGKSGISNRYAVAIKKLTQGYVLPEHWEEALICNQPASPEVEMEDIEEEEEDFDGELYGGEGSG